MNFRLNSLLARLLLSNALPLVLFVAVALVAGIAITRLYRALQAEIDSHVLVTQAFQLQDRLGEMRRPKPLLALGVGGDDPAASRIDFEDSRREFRLQLGKLKSRLTGAGDQLARLQRIEDLEAAWSPIALALVEPVAPGVRSQAERNRLEQQSKELAGKIQDEIAAVVRAEEETLFANQRLMSAQAGQSIWLIAVTVPVAMALALVAALWAAGGVTGPIKRLHQATRELIAGRYQVLPSTGPTEIAELIRHFNHMGITLSALRQQKESYQRYIGATSHIMWSTDPRGAVVADIPTWRAFTGQSEEEILGQGWLGAIHAEDLPVVRQAWSEAIVNKTPFDVDCRLRSQQGEYGYFHCRGVAILNADGSVREWLGTCTDVTEQRREAELQRAKEAAEASNRAKGEFLAKMSHELRTPLNAVIGMSKMLRTERFGSLTTKQADYLHDITMAGEHLLALINDILDIAKVESGRMELQAEAFQPNEAVMSVLSTLRPLAEEKRLSLRVAPVEEERHVHTDPAHFRQVLYNLLSNAIKFTPKDGRVTIDCQWVAGTSPEAAVVSAGEAQALRVAVEDTGVGIAREHQAIIWEEFRQVHPANSSRTQGTGLGLALTHKLVALMGGRIWLESEVDRGSTFTFVLPRRLPPPAREPVSPTESAPVPDASRPLALVIEDYAATRKLLQDWLVEEGLAVAVAGDGETGLDLARKLKPRLVVLDIHLPGIDGWQVLRELKSQPTTAAIPALIVSVTEDYLPSTGLEVSEFFVKPVEREVFLRHVRELLPELLLTTAAVVP